jgi:ArsR family transcriptional regulator, arsenate/arsenite/antimonite-responsive transcriptional repressor
MQDFARVMKALSDPGRIKVVRMLAQREMCACEIVDLLGLAQPTVSRHLRVLQDAGLIVVRRVGVWGHYRLPKTSDKAYVSLVLENLPQWLSHDAELRALVERVGEENPCLPGRASSGKMASCTSGHNAGQRLATNLKETV